MVGTTSATRQVVEIRLWPLEKAQVTGQDRHNSDTGLFLHYGDLSDSVTVVILVLIGGLYYFRRTEKTFADVV